MELKSMKSHFLQDLKKISRAMLDSSILIYHLEDCEPYSELTEALITLMGKGALKCILSTISITELLTKPYVEGDTKKILQFRAFIRSLPHTSMAAPDEETAEYAAYLRGRLGFRTPDALLIATAKIEKADVFVTNDVQLKKAEKEGIRILLLEEYIPGV
jgi:predicted nucleic acid-binding protein